MRKRRTRNHVIEDLSVNHVERQALLCGFSIERIRHDYGIDCVLFTYDSTGEIENGQVYLQVKATETARTTRGGYVAVAIERRDLAYWLSEPMPVVLMLYDGTRDRAYWIYVQAYFEADDHFDLARASETVTIRLSADHVLDASAMRRFARFRDDVLRQSGERIRHYE